MNGRYQLVQLVAGSLQLESDRNSCIMDFLMN